MISLRLCKMKTVCKVDYALKINRIEKLVSISMHFKNLLNSNSKDKIRLYFQNPLEVICKQNDIIST